MIEFNYSRLSIYGRDYNQSIIGIYLCIEYPDITVIKLEMQ